MGNKTLLDESVIRSTLSLAKAEVGLEVIPVKEVKIADVPESFVIPDRKIMVLAKHRISTPEGLYHVMVHELSHFKFRFFSKLLHRELNFQKLSDWKKHAINMSQNLWEDCVIDTIMPSRLAFKASLVKERYIKVSGGKLKVNLNDIPDFTFVTCTFNYFLEDTSKLWNFIKYIVTTYHQIKDSKISRVILDNIEDSEKHHISMSKLALDIPSIDRMTYDQYKSGFYHALNIYSNLSIVKDIIPSKYLVIPMNKLPRGLPIMPSSSYVWHGLKVKVKRLGPNKVKIKVIRMKVR